APSLVPDPGRHGAGPTTRLGGRAVDVDVALELPVPPVDLELRVVEDLAKRRLHLPGCCQVGDRLEDLPDRVEPGGDRAHGPGCTSSRGRCHPGRGRIATAPRDDGSLDDERSE